MASPGTTFEKDFRIILRPRLQDRRVGSIDVGPADRNRWVGLFGMTKRLRETAWQKATEIGKRRKRVKRFTDECVEADLCLAQIFFRLLAFYQRRSEALFSLELIASVSVPSFTPEVISLTLLR